MNAITSRLAPLSVAAAGVLAVAGAAQADSRHHHAYSHLPHTHTYSNGHAHGSHHSGGQAIGNAIIVGGLLLGGIALLDALSDSNTVFKRSSEHWQLCRRAWVSDTRTPSSWKRR